MSSNSPVRLRRLLGAVLAALIVGMGAVAPAAAAPGDGTTTLNWRQLGMGTSVTIDGADVPVGVSIPVPQGMSPMSRRSRLS